VPIIDWVLCRKVGVDPVFVVILSTRPEGNCPLQRKKGTLIEKNHLEWDNCNISNREIAKIGVKGDVAKLKKTAEGASKLTWLMVGSVVSMTKLAVITLIATHPLP
jgi:hypothetical protein